MSKKPISLLLMLIAMALFVVACGGGAAEDAREAVQQAQEEVEEAVEEAQEAAEEVVEEVEETAEEVVEEAEEVVEEAVEAMTGDSLAMAPCESLTPVSLQLQWVTQSQFAGFYAALDQGFYEEFCLDVTILEGAVDIVPQQVVASGQAEFGVAWVPKVLASREEGANLVNIGQIFQRSGTLEVSWADAPVASIEDMAGKKVGTWGFGNEHELFVAMRNVGIDPDNASDVEIVQQSFDMLALLNRELDAAQAMTYNEYAQVLEAENPETGELYQPEDLVVIDFNDVGTAMLQDHLFVDGDWLAEEGNEAIATQFLAGTFKGWQFCRDEFESCVDIVLSNGPTLGEGHMTWQLNEINKLIWPSPAGIGVMDQGLWDQTVEVAIGGGVIAEAPEGAFRSDLAEAALAALDGDMTGEAYKPLAIRVTPGGGSPADGESLIMDEAMMDDGDAMMEEAAVAMAPCESLTPVSLQLQWVTQSQFAGFYAARDQGFYEEFCLDVTILEGAVDIVPQQVVASGQAEFGVAWVPKVLASREEGADLVNIGQIFQRSGTLQVSWADSPVATIDDMAGKKVGTWGFGNEHELFVALRGAGLDPDNPSDVEIVQQSFDMLALLNRELDAAQAMTYNEYAQVLESENPETGELFQPEDLVVIDYNDVGTAMLQDHVFVDGGWLAEEGNEAVATQFLAATFKGWQFCRDNFEPCVETVLANGPTLGEGHMAWQLNEINKLIWPSPAGIGVMDQDLWDQTVEVSLGGSVIAEAPDGAFRSDLAEAALTALDGDLTGADYKPVTVLVTPGGGSPADGESLIIEDGAMMDDGEAMMEEAMALPECDGLTPVSLQLQWVTQSQFAGFYAALDQGFFEEHCLDVTILEGAVDIVPQQVVASGQAEFGVAWVPKVLASREEGADLVNIGQVFQRSGTLQVSWADSPVATIDDMAGKKVGTWGFGNEHELFVALRGAGLDPDNTADVEIVQQSFDMLALLNRELDAAQAMTYNEYAQVLESENPETGELFQPEDLVVIDYNDVGTAMLQDHVFVDGGWLAEEGNEEIAVQFLAGVYKGWQFCRDNVEGCVDIVLANGPTLGESHMLWQMNEINKLIWPSPAGVGLMDQALWDQTVEVSLNGGVITEAPDGAFRNDLTLEAHKFLSGDVTGEGYAPIDVELRAGGE